MVEAQLINGDNVTAVIKLVKNVESDPKLGECRFHIKNNWSTCGQNQSKVSSFYAAKQEIPHEDPFFLDFVRLGERKRSETNPRSFIHSGQVRSQQISLRVVHYH